MQTRETVCMMFAIGCDCDNICNETEIFLGKLSKAKRDIAIQTNKISAVNTKWETCSSNWEAGYLKNH